MIIQVLEEILFFYMHESWTILLFHEKIYTVCTFDGKEKIGILGLLKSALRAFFNKGSFPKKSQ